MDCHNRVPNALSLLVFVCLVSPVLAQEPTTPDQIPIDAFAQLPAMQSAEISPDGSHLAYISPSSGRGHLIIQRLVSDGTAPVVVPPGDTTDFRWLHWANDDRLVFSASASRKRDNVETLETRLLAIDEDGANSTNLIEPSRRKGTGSNVLVELPPAQVQDDVIHWLPDEPNFILVALDGDHNAADEIRRIDLSNGNFRVIQPDYDGVQSWLPDRSGNPRLGWGYRNSAFKVMTRNADRQWRTATEAGWRDAGFFPQGFSDTADVAYMIGPDENGIEVLRTMNVSTGEFLETMLARDGIDVGGILRDPVTWFPVGAYITEHETEYHYFDKTLAALQRAIDKAQPGTVNQIVSTTSDRRKILVRASSDVDPGAYFFLDRDVGSLDFIAESMPGLPPELMSPMEPVSYKARDGLTIPGYLIVPRGMPRENLKTVVLPHGGPAARDEKTFWFLSQFLASRGYAVFQPNFRGSSGYGRRFEYAGRNEWGGKMQQDVTDGVQWLIDEGIADPEKMCIVGWSYGGYAAAMGAVQTPELYQCAASINGVLNLPRLIADDRAYIGGTVWTRHMGLEDERAFTVSPYQQAEHINIPMLIIQAADDVRVHLDQGKRMARRLERQDKPVEYVEVELGGHSMRNEVARRKILASLEAFLAKNIAP
ncbi:MAG: alpha/beta fold hydrolase [Woeseiaceae bacterium]